MGMEWKLVEKKSVPKMSAPALTPKIVFTVGGVPMKTAISRPKDCCLDKPKTSKK